jgi:DNA-binding Lrp family transcriptional regulator
MDDPILEYNILDSVHENDGSLTQRHISNKLRRSVASVNFALRLLAVKGYIKITGANPRNLKYHLTPSGLLRKSVLAYNFLRRQSALYEDVRADILKKLKDLAADGVRQVAVYGWTPFTEAAILYLMSEGIKVNALYVSESSKAYPLNRIPLRAIQEFQPEGEALVLLERLPGPWEAKISIRKVACFPVPWGEGAGSQ